MKEKKVNKIELQYEAEIATIMLYKRLVTSAIEKSPEMVAAITELYKTLFK